MTGFTIPLPDDLLPLALEARAALLEHNRAYDKLNRDSDPHVNDVYRQEWREAFDAEQAVRQRLANALVALDVPRNATLSCPLDNDKTGHIRFVTFLDGTSWVLIGGLG